MSHLGATGIGLASYNAFGQALGRFQTASAATTSGYKALVCIFLLGGADCHDVLIPYDQTSYDEYETIRAELIAEYAKQPAGYSRARDRLLALSPTNAASFGTRAFALPEQLSGIKGLIDSGKASVIANVGPLVERVVRSEIEAETANLPPRLFSHNDQQSVWMSSAPEGARTGWGGAFADAAITSGANTNTEFTTISSLGNQVFLTGEKALPFQVTESGDFFYESLGYLEGYEGFDLMQRHLRAESFTSQNLLEQDIASLSRRSVDINSLYNDTRKAGTPLATTFPNTSLGKQLRAIAETIAVHGVLGMSRQVFMAAMGGFDTHSQQAAVLPVLMTQLDDAIIAFQSALTEMGMSDSVTTFTASDFGRTLAVNGDGTDHGWGAHHFVIGPAYTGNMIHGTPPPASLGHALDAGGGRLIPSQSVEEYAAPLGRWFGLTDAELGVALPNLSNF